jgi:hypothetical protein
LNGINFSLYQLFSYFKYNSYLDKVATVLSATFF